MLECREVKPSLHEFVNELEHIAQFYLRVGKNLFEKLNLLREDGALIFFESKFVGKLVEIVCTFSFIHSFIQAPFNQIQKLKNLNMYYNNFLN